MRVLLVTPSYFPIVGGSEVLTQVLSTKLNEKGVHADIMTLNMNEKWNTSWKIEVTKDGKAEVFREAAFNPLPYLFNPLFNLFRINVIPNPSFTKKLREYDVIHFVGEADLSFPLFSFFIRKPKLLQCVGIFKKGGLYKYYTFERASFGGVFKKFFPKLANKFIISSLEEKKLLMDIGISENKITILPIGVDLDVFCPDLNKKTGNLVLFVGRIDRIKGLHFLLKALSYIKTPVEVVAIGPPWNSEYMKKIERMSKEINETGFHKVTLIGGMNQGDLVPWYQRASVLVCPYEYETGSNVVRESLACGTPVVSTGSHIVEHCSDGILLSRNDPVELAKAIEELMSNHLLREQYGKEGRSAIESCFSWESIVDDLVGLYKNMVSEFTRG